MDVDRISADKSFAKLGKPATYIPTIGTVVQTKAILDVDVVRIGQLGLVVENADLIDIPAKDVPRPKIGAIIRTGGSDWRIDSVDSRENEVFTLVVVECPST